MPSTHKASDQERKEPKHICLCSYSSCNADANHPCFCNCHTNGSEGCDANSFGCTSCKLPRPDFDDSTPSPTNSSVEPRELERILEDFASEWEDAFDPYGEIGSSAEPRAKLLAEAKARIERLLVEARVEVTYGLLSEQDKKCLSAKDMRADERSMSYIARKLGYKYASGVHYLLDTYTSPVLEAYLKLKDTL